MSYTPANLDPKLRPIVALWRGTTFPGERAAARYLGEAIAQRAGMSFDEVVALYDSKQRPRPPAPHAGRPRPRREPGGQRRRYPEDFFDGDFDELWNIFRQATSWRQFYRTEGGWKRSRRYKRNANFAEDMARARAVIDSAPANSILRTRKRGAAR